MLLLLIRGYEQSRRRGRSPSFTASPPPPPPRPFPLSNSAELHKDLSFATRQIGCSSSLVVVEITVNSLLIAVPPHASRYSERPLSLSSSKETFLDSFFFSFLFVVLLFPFCSFVPVFFLMMMMMSL